MASLTLTPMDRNGDFNNLLIHGLVNNQESIDRIIRELVMVMKAKGYRGLTIDFEYIFAEDRDAFSAFVWQAAETLRTNGYTTSVALAPKTSADQSGILYSGKDYQTLGEAADRVFLMTYERGYTYGPPMAVAPLGKVRQVVEYALTEMPADKIILGIPNYGYDWALPFIRGVTKAVTINHIQAVRIAVEHNAVIKFDDIARSPYFIYWNDGIEHQVWFEDVRSLQGKLDLVREYDLYGCGYWQIMEWFRANWLLLNHNFDIIKVS